MKTTAALLFIAISWNSFAQTGNNASTKNLNLDKGIALNGYDAVAYIAQQQAIEGTEKFSYTHLGATYYFVTQQNLNLFKTNPTAYLPQYGGWCAYAMGARGEKVEVDPETFKIIDGKLFLFYNKYFNNTLNSWNKDETNLRKKADANWMKINKQSTGNSP